MVVRSHPWRGSLASQIQATVARRPLRAYLFIAFGGTWLALLPAVLGRNGLGLLPIDVPDAVFVLLFIGGTALGPTMGAWLVTAATGGGAGLRSLLRRYVQWRVGPQWYLLALLGPLAINLLAAALLLGAVPVRALAAQWPLIFTTFLQAVLGMIIFPALLEEPGWRGVALPYLQARFGPLPGALILGTLHGLWHLPVYLLVSSPAALGPFNPQKFVLNTIGIVLVSIFWAWVYARSGQSIMMAILLHAANNATPSLIRALIPQLPAAFGPTTLMLYAATALTIILATRGQLGYGRAVPDGVLLQRSL